MPDNFEEAVIRETETMTTEFTDPKELMRRIREEVIARRGGSDSAPLAPVKKLDRPPTLHLTPLNPVSPARFEEMFGIAKKRTSVSRWIPNFLRGLFRRQGGFNKQVLDLAKLLMRENREVQKRIREIGAYLAAERDWLADTADARETILAEQQSRLHSLNQRLQKTWESGRSVEARLSSLEPTVARILEAGAAHEAAQQHIREDQRQQIERCSNTLEAMREALRAETKAREQVSERAIANHQRLDVYFEALAAIRAANEAEQDSRSVLRERLEQGEEEAKKLREQIERQLQRTGDRHVSEMTHLRRQLHLHEGKLLGLSPNDSSGSAQAEITPTVDAHEFDAFYVAFEDQFRGSRADIKQRAAVYLPFLGEAHAGSQDRPILDLGCGRGEWLELLREQNLRACGVDLNTFMVEECAGRGLDVTQADVIGYLTAMPADSVGAVSAFHLIEHLPFAVFLRLFRESLRVLKPGGICIFETPNPDNLQVGANRFYSDPTHLRPLPKDFTRFVMETTGFADVKLLPLHPDADALSLEGDGTPVERIVNHLFFGEQDYAVIGRK